MPFATSLRLGLVIARESGKGVPDRREGGALRHLGATCRARRSARFGLPQGWDACRPLHHELADVAVNFGP
jgi:hypothetical protein